MSKVRSILNRVFTQTSSTRQYRAMRKAVFATAILATIAISISTIQISRNGLPLFTFRAGGVGETAGTETDQMFLAKQHRFIPAVLDRSFTTQWHYLKKVIVKPAALLSYRTYTIRPGDTLSSIAARMYGSAASWPSLWWVNRGQIQNPNNINVGQTIRLDAWHPVASWLTSAADSAIPAPPPTRVVAKTVTNTSSPSHSAPVSTAPVQTSAVSTSGDSAFQACVISRESGGNPDVWNASGHWGLYQFSKETWVAHGGDPALFGNADQAYQNEIFWNTFRADGTSDWAPYDGC